MRTCHHDLAALQDHLCADCIIEQMYGHEIRSVRSIMRDGPLNIWRR